MASEAWKRTGGPGQKLYRAPAVTVFFVVCLILWLLHRDGANGWRPLLALDSPTPASFLTSHLFHTSGLELMMNSLVVLLLGMILESRWGTLRFLLFYFLCAWGSTAFSLLMARAFSVEDGYSWGASSVALGCLVSVGALYPDTRLVRWVPANRFLVWVGVFVVCGLLPLLPAPSVDGEDTTRVPYLLPQAAGVPLALFFVSILPRCDAWFVRRQQRAEEARRVRVREIRSRVDRLLEKISAEGYESLSPDELHFLRDASKHYRDP